MGRKLLTDRWINSRRQAVCAAILLPAFAMAYLSGYLLRFDGHLDAQTWGTFTATVGWVLLVKFFVFAWFRVYQGWSRFVTFHDLMLIAQAATVSSFITALGDYLLLPNLVIPRSVFLLDWGTTIVVIGGLRALIRVVRQRQGIVHTPGDRVPVFIAGVNQSGETLLRAIQQTNSLPYHVVGFLCQDGSNLYSRIGGVPVIGTIEQAFDLAARRGVSEILITSSELPGRQVRRLVEGSGRHEVAVKVLPSYQQLLQGSVKIEPRAVSIEDLLRRDPVDLDMTELHRWIEGRTCLVTGSAGSIGSEICRQLLRFSPQRLVLIDRSENGQFFLQRELCSLAPRQKIEVLIGDIADTQRMGGVFGKYEPDIVFHAAAYKHVPLMEINPGEAVKNIVIATRHLADLARQHEVESFVMISTDKAVNPTSVMGACKRAAELYVQSLAESASGRFVTVRFGNVLDSAGSVVPIFRDQIAAGGPVTVTHADMVRYFMTIPEASQLVVQAGAMGSGGEIFVLDMGDPVRIVDLAADMIRLSGLKMGEDVEIEFTGLRPGEKLFEELRADGEMHVGTSHPKILVSRSRRRELAEVRLRLMQLESLADGPDDVIMGELASLVPEYVPRLALPLEKPSRIAA